MTTTQPTALPELPEPAHRGPTGTGAYFDSFTADQMRAYALATLQAQQSTQGDTQAAVGVSYEEIERVARSHGTGGWQTLPDMIRFARTALALRPQSESEARKPPRRANDTIC